ncbi:unnamed protein product [Rotaria sordida]|uniref:Chorein N-terminal domain-containing protein n=3 Tax=Rotaria sordida TaxID=392033 RepID=A0A815NET6_9BILA|nr:unnamed protein product [Rotaria sordida]CAF1634379.1 unnamed protein product [Rotaria sordida]
MKVISRLSISNGLLEFQRRPARDDIQLVIDLNSLEMSGIDSELNNNENELNLSRPILIQSFNQTNNLLHIEFETNPLNSKSDYRIQAKSQPLQINYHAMTINTLIECFLPDRHHDLEGIKEAAYSIYTDIKHRTQFLVSENLKKIKDLDIDIDLQSIYFIVPESGFYQSSSSVICLDLGHLTFKNGEKNIQNSEKDVFYDAKSDQDDLIYVPLKIQLENVQLLYLTQNENWIDVRLQEDSPSHLIKPITLTLDLEKLIHIENNKLPIWKANGEIHLIESNISDRRLIGCFNLIESIPFPQSTEKSDQDQYKKSLSKNKKHQTTTKQHYDQIESMTPIKKILLEQEQEQDQQKQIEIKSGEQTIQLSIDFQIRKVYLL